jgi:hypothetical protein
MPKTIRNNYKLFGTYRKQSAVGAMQSFEITIDRSTPKIAMDTARILFYEDGYDHILFTKVMHKGREIPMMQALELE